MSFDVFYPLDAEKHAAVRKRWLDLTNKAKAVGITLHADGTFDGRASGKVEITPSALTIEVEDKPWAVPEFVVRQELKKMLDGFFA
jgi:hypothetical protein